MNYAERFGKIKKILIYILVLNWSVAAMKVLYGIMTRCASMRADGLHSFADGSSNIIGLVGIWVAARPIDKGHPYGHKKYETFAAIGIGIILVLLCVDVLRNAVVRFYNPVIPDVTVISFVVIIVTLFINVCVMLHERRMAVVLKSDILHSDAMHTASDILISLSVIVTLISIYYGFPIVDTIVALGIAVFIGLAAFRIFRDCSYVLCDTAPVVADRIKNIVKQIDGVEQCHKIRTRGRQDDVHVDLHCLVNPNMHVGTAHTITEVIEGKIKKGIPGVTDVVVHIEPA